METEPRMEIVMNADKDPKNVALGVDRLRSLIERIERLQEEVKEIQSDIKDIFAEAKAVGYDVKIMREVIKLRKMNAVDRDEQEYLIDTYKRALGL
jgi:uncharacterized protein (UPF0335 family)